MAKQDYYSVLGLRRNASDKEIKQAYRRLARQYHPDVNPGDAAAEQQFKEISEAYSVLSNPESRKKYDRFGHQAFATGFDPAFAGGGGFAGGYTGNLKDFFGGRASFEGLGSIFEELDRKSTRLNSSHSQISYAVFCLKKKKDIETIIEYYNHPYHPKVKPLIPWIDSILQNQITTQPNPHTIQRQH